jgi:hypothetical protein
MAISCQKKKETDRDTALVEKNKLLNPISLLLLRMMLGM